MITWRVTDAGELIIECEEPYDEGAETYAENIGTTASIELAWTILMRSLRTMTINQFLTTIKDVTP